MSDLHERARRVIPGGVSSPARAFGAVGGDPVHAARGEGPYLVAADGTRYVDYVQGFGAIILGHSALREGIAEAAARGTGFGLGTEAEVELAERVVEALASVERVRFVASGTEASMTAARIARAATGRDVIVTFEGCYHGHADAFLARAGSGVATYSVPTAGVAPAGVENTVVLAYNDAGAVKQLLSERGREIAAVFVEPVAANMGVVPGERAFLEAIVDGAASCGALVVFDEVVTGFRLGRGGAQGRLEMRPDLTMLGKVIGGGLPVGAIGGRAELMDLLAPQGPVYQAGTYAAHPLSMAAGVAVLDALDDAAFSRLEGVAAELADGLADAAARASTHACVVREGTLVSVSFTDRAPRSFADAATGDRDAFARFHRELRARKVLLPPSPFEAWFPSLAHDGEAVTHTLSAARAALAAVG